MLKLVPGIEPRVGPDDNKYAESSDQCERACATCVRACTHVLCCVALRRIALRVIYLCACAHAHGLGWECPCVRACTYANMHVCVVHTCLLACVHGCMHACTHARRLGSVHASGVAGQLAYQVSVTPCVRSCVRAYRSVRVHVHTGHGAADVSEHAVVGVLRLKVRLSRSKQNLAAIYMGHN